MSTILSVDDERLIELPHTIGDRFYFYGTLDLYDKEMREVLENRDIIVEVESFELFEDGTIGYKLGFIRPEYSWKWSVPLTILESDFMPIKKNIRNLRFMMLE